MRKIDSIIIHCSDTPAGRDVPTEEIKRWHVEERGWSDIGYHYVIELDGTVKEGRPISRSGAHASGYNANSIGVCYVGGKGGDTRRPEQNAALVKLIFELKVKYGIANEDIKGHNEVSSKACPNFSVRDWIEGLKWD